VRAVLDLQPGLRSARPVRAVGPLRRAPVETESAGGVLEDVGNVAGNVVDVLRDVPPLGPSTFSKYRFRSSSGCGRKSSPSNSSMRSPTSDAREAVKALIVANDFLEAQLNELRAKVSTGYARGRLQPARERKDEVDV
jgi:hypothetical protein